MARSFRCLRSVPVDAMRIGGNGSIKMTTELSPDEIVVRPGPLQAGGPAPPAPAGRDGAAAPSAPWRHDGAAAPIALPCGESAVTPTGVPRHDGAMTPTGVPHHDDGATPITLRLHGGSVPARDDACSADRAVRGGGTDPTAAAIPRETWQELLAALRGLVEFQDAVVEHPPAGTPGGAPGAAPAALADGWRVLLSRAPMPPHPPRRHDAAHRLQLLAMEHASPLGIRLQREPAHPFTATEAALLARAAPMLRLILDSTAGAAGLRRIAHQATRVSDALLSVLDQLGLGLCVLDAELRPLMVSGRGLRSGAIRVRRNALVLPDRAAELRLRAAVAAVLAPRDGGVQGLNLGCATRPAYALVTTLRQPDREEDAPLAALLLLPDAAPVHAERVIQAMFGLTPVEARIAKQLADGLTLNEAAEQMRMRPNTLRSYMKSIFVKLDLHRQSELVRLISTTAGLLRGHNTAKAVPAEAAGALRLGGGAIRAGADALLLDDPAAG